MRDEFDTGGEGGCTGSRCCLFASCKSSAPSNERFCDVTRLDSIASSSFGNTTSSIVFCEASCDARSCFLLLMTFFHCVAANMTKATRSKCGIGGAAFISSHSTFFNPTNALLKSALANVLVMYSICSLFRLASRSPKRRVRYPPGADRKLEGCVMSGLWGLSGARKMCWSVWRSRAQTWAGVSLRCLLRLMLWTRRKVEMGSLCSSSSSLRPSMSARVNEYFPGEAVP
jgi:hypothetical protein